MKSFYKQLKHYASLAIQVGINLQKGQKLYITAPVSSAEFARMLVEEAFACGAKDVYVDWVDEQVRHSRLKHTDTAVLSQIPDWMVQRRLEVAEEGGAFLSILAEDPELMKDIDANKISTFMKNLRMAMKPVSEYTMSSKISWSIVAIPTLEWADKVFDKDPDAVTKLWNAIFKVVRVDQEDPIQAWRDHTDNLKRRKDFLNKSCIQSLHFTSEGTDLIIDLPEKHYWQGGAKNNGVGTSFVANIPTEEVFTLPHHSGVNGKVRSTMPLNYMGNLITDITLEFENGKISRYSSSEGFDTLKGLLETDEGAIHLGEVALVPYHSPISDLGFIFYNTLFDENASCHLAFGRAYPTSLVGGPDMTEEERHNNGANFSLIHIDFMIGGPDTQITATMKDGSTSKIFIDGDWAI
jgi:aminopeptidase